MTTEELLNAGIAAAKAGDALRASKLLMQAVQADPNSELGWLWLGLCRTAADQREYCFQRVLTINPQNAEARRQLEILHASTVNSQGIEPPNPWVVEAPQAISRDSQTVNPPRQAGTSAPRKRRNNNNAIYLWIGGGITALICVSVAAFIVLDSLFGRENIFGAGLPTALPTTAAVVRPTPNYAPVFEAGNCNFNKPAGARVTCGFVTVPEDRDGDLTDTVKIAVAVFHSSGSAPKPDPILYLQGGPGSEAISWSVSVYEDVIAPLLGERDFVVFDPRGVGFSIPSLACDEFATTYLHDLEGKIPAGQQYSYYEGALLGCKNSLHKLGANLSTYITTNTAADARDVLLALGYQQANLYGISYGTRAAQFMMRDYPEVVRSAILDSVVPVETQLLNQEPGSDDDILRILFEDCKADPACAAAYPDLEAAYHEVFDRLNAEPIPVKVTLTGSQSLEQTINGYTFRDAVMWALRVPQTISLAPQLIYRVRDGDTSILTLSLAFPLLTFDSISLGTYISVTCHDQVFAMSMEKLDNTIYEMCSLWEVRPLRPGENDPVNSEIPALIFAGRYDSTTPPAFAYQLAGHLPHSYIALIPDQGHAPSATGISDCPTRVILAFLQDPNTAPDLTCVNEIKPVKFVVPYNADTPIALRPARLDQYQVDTLIPEGWNGIGLGFYDRGGSYGDVTQIGIQRAAVTESEWVKFLETNFRTDWGFDQPATRLGERQSNGLLWSIYQTTSHGHPVDIAFTSSDNQTLMVLLISYKDEHEALYNAVFLPVIDSTTSLH